MYKMSAQSLIALTLATNLSLLTAATPSIGVALANGSINIDKTRMPGNAPLFEGNTIETDRASSRLQLTNGVRVVLATDSKGTIYKDRMVLEKGTTQVDTPGKYDVSARFLRVSGTDGNSSARVAMHGATVEVASLSGTLQVANAQGVMLTRIAPGMAFNFTPQDQGATAGTDSTTGKKKKKKGAAAADAGGSTASAGTGAGTGAAAAGMGASHATAIIAGIVIAAAVGTTAGVLATNGESQPNQAISPARP